MKSFKIVALILVVAILLSFLYINSVFALTPTPTRTITKTPTATKTPTPTPTPSGKPIYPGNQMNVHEQNRTGQPANDLEVYLTGKVTISQHWNSGSNPFMNFTVTYDPVNNVTILRWSNGIVNPGEWVHTCLYVQASQITYRYLTQWTWNGVPIGTVGASISNDFQDNGGGKIMEVGNTAENSGPSMIAMIQIGVTYNVYTLPDLVWDNLNTIPWAITMYNIHLNPGESRALPAIAVPNGANIVYRYKVYLDADPSNIVDYIGQYTPMTTPPINQGNQMNVHEQNNTNQPANDLEIYLDGKVIVTRHYNSGANPFQNFSATYDSMRNITILRWFNGTVNPGEWVHTCLWIEYTRVTHRLVTQWTWNGVPIGNVGAAVSQDIKEIAPGIVNVNLINTPEDGGPVTVAVAQIGSVRTTYKLETLVWDNLNNIPWDVSMTNIHLNQGAGISLPKVTIPQGEIGIVYRYRVYLDKEPMKVVDYIGQYVPMGTATPTPTPTPMPTL